MHVCGEDVLPPLFQRLAPTVSLSNLLGMARNSIEADQCSEAESYFKPGRT